MGKKKREGTKQSVGVSAFVPEGKRLRPARGAANTAKGSTPLCMESVIIKRGGGKRCPGFGRIQSRRWRWKLLSPRVTWRNVNTILPVTGRGGYAEGKKRMTSLDDRRKPASWTIKLELVTLEVKEAWYH